MPRSAVLRLKFRTPRARATAFQRLIKSMGADATDGDGAKGVDAVAAGQTEGDERWVVTVRFDDKEALRRWRASDAAGHWRERLEQVSIEQPLVQIRDGVAVWFEPASRYAASLPKWKTAVLSALGIYPATLALDVLLTPISGRPPHWSVTLLTVCVLSALVTWAIRPTLTRVFRRRLYPHSSAGSHGEPPART